MHRSARMLLGGASGPCPVSRLSFLRFLSGIAMVICVCTHVNAQGDPAVMGQWSAVFSTNYEPVHTMVLPTGKVLFWSLKDQSLNPQIWDPATGNLTPTPLPNYQVFCAGHSFLGDGQLLVTGGNLGDFVGVAYASLYNPVSNTWTRVPDMNAARWYPTNTTLANGDVVVVSGEINNSTGVDTLAQVWQAASQSWRDLTTAQLALSLYPRMFLAPNGKVFYATPNSPSRYLDTSGTGAWTTVSNLNFNSRDYDTAVMYAPGKILTVGGADPPTATAEVIDLNAASPAWRYVGSMATARRQLNGTILADGKVLITGGSSGSGFDNASAPVYLTEMWDPVTEQFTPMASITKYRGYHSNAVLLPDGRVLSAGGDVSGATAEIFSPPYLFKGARPTISSGPTKIQYGQTFSIGTPDAASITQVNLIRLSSVTHSFNQDQRINSLRFTVGSASLNIQAPVDGTAAPPGPYMLIILNGSGVPSVAQIVQMTADVPPTAKAGATPTSGPVPLNVTFSSAGSFDPDGSVTAYAWDFGDGQSSSAANTSHTYSSPGTYAANLTVTDNQGATGAQTLFVTATVANPPPPRLLSVSPASGTQGATLNVVLAGSNFQSGAKCDFGPGINVTSCVFNSTSQLSAHLVLDPAAPPGAHSVTVTNADGQPSAPLTGGFVVNLPPSIISVTPNSGAQAQTVTSILTGNNFQVGSACSFGSGINVTSCVFNSATQATATVSILPTASLGPRDITVTDPDSQSGRLSGGFSVTPMVGGTLHLDFNYPNRDALFAAGWDFNAKAASGAIRDTELSGPLAVDYRQTVHPGTIRVPILAGQIYLTPNTSQNTLLQDLPGDWISIRLMIASFAPVANYQQVDLVAYQDDDNYVALGREMDGNPPTPALRFYQEQGALVPPGGSNQALNNTGNLMLRLDRDATSNTYTAYFSVDSGSSWTAMGSLVQALNNPRLAIVTGANLAAQITADLAWVEIIRPGTAAPPTISFIGPGSGVQGQNATVVITGSNFQSGAQCSFGIGISINSCTFNSASQVTAAVAISATAPLGMHDVTVTNPDGQSGTLGGGFFVNSGGPQPVITSVSPNSAAQGQSLSSVVLRGSNFESGAQCDFGAGITVSACSFSSATQLTASLTIAPSAAVGSRNVTVTNPHNQSFTLTAGFSVTQGTVVLAPTSLSFDNQAIGTTSPPSAAVLTNQTSTDLSITAFNISGDFIQTNNCGASLPSETSCTINVSFRPTGQGTVSGVMSVSDSGPNSPQVITLTGTGTAPPNLSVSPTLLDFGGVIVNGQSPSQAVTLRVSNAPLSIQGIDVTSSAFGRRNQCPTDVAGGGECSILVFFQPNTLGIVTATMHIQDDAAGSPQVVQLQGEGSHFVLVPAGGSGQVIAAGQSASFSVGLQSLAGTSETVSVSCSVAPPLSACTLSQSSFPLNGSLQTLTVTVPTTARSNVLRLGAPIGPASQVVLWFGVFGTIFLVLASLRPNSLVSSRSLRLMHVLSAALLMALATGMISCSGGTNSGGPSHTGTQAGQYVVTITGTSSNPANPPQSVRLPFSVN